MNCEAHPKAPAAVVVHTACCKLEIPWCVSCALETLDAIGRYADYELECKHCGAGGTVKTFFVFPAQPQV